MQFSVSRGRRRIVHLIKTFLCSTSARAATSTTFSHRIAAKSSALEVSLLDSSKSLVTLLSIQFFVPRVNPSRIRLASETWSVHRSIRVHPVTAAKILQEAHPMEEVHI